MNEYIKIAWRNLWRNRRRTFLTLASVLFAVFLALLMRSMQLGTYASMIENSVKNSTGYIQVHEKGYWDDKSIDNTFASGPALEQKISTTPNVTQIIPRLESFALISSGKQTKGAAVIGTDPAEENAVSGLKKKLVEGSYIDTNSTGALVSQGLADYLKVKVNDTIVMLGQGYHGNTAAAAIPVTGIVKFIQPEMNNQMVFLPLKLAQSIYSAPGRLTSISIMLKDPDRLSQTMAALEKIDPEKLEVMSWRTMLTELLQGIEGDNISGQFMLGILYLVVGFGILGTVLMMTLERRREFGIMVAVGMRRYKLALIVLMETIIIGIAGVICGMIVGLPVVAYLHAHPIPLTGEAADAVLAYNMNPEMPFALDPVIFLHQAMVVLIITLITVIYPMTVISRFRVINAIKGR